MSGDLTIFPEFHHVRVLHKRYETTRHVFVIWPDAAEPQQKASGGIYIHAERLPPDEKHVALGRFMDAWSKLEGLLRQKTALLLLTAHEPTARTIVAPLSGKTLMDTNIRLVSLHLPKAGLDEYKGMAKRFGTLNTKRNTIAHGYWVLEIEVRSDGDGSPFLISRAVRELPPASDLEREKLNSLREQRARAKHLMSQDDILAAESDVAKLYADFVAFYEGHKVFRRSVISETIA